MTLEDIYIENYPIVFGYLLSLCGDPVEAEELTAQTFLKAVDNIRKYDKSCKPSTWLCTIARNLYFNEYRRKKRQVPLEEARFSVISPEEIYLEKDMAKRIYGAAASLETPYREVFFLRMEGLTFRQIGMILDKTENWARVTYYRAKTKIQKETEDDHG